MSRPPTPQYVETASGWSWTWKTWEGRVLIDLFTPDGKHWSWVCGSCGQEGRANTHDDGEAAGRKHARTHQVEHEVELEWLQNDERWQVRSRYDRAGWTDVLVVHDLDDPESFDHADNLARDYAARPRGR